MNIDGQTLRIVERAPKASNDQATKSIRWMPWHWQAMKDAVTSDTPRIGGSNLGPVDFRMEQSVQSNVCTLPDEFIVGKESTRRTEISKYPEEKKSIEITQVATSEKVFSLNLMMC